MSRVFNITNPIFFWLLVVILLGGVVFLNQSYFTKEVKNEQVIQEEIQKQSFDQKQQDSGIIDLNKLSTTDIELESEQTGFSKIVS